MTGRFDEVGRTSGAGVGRYESTKVGSAFAHWGYGVTGRFDEVGRTSGAGVGRYESTKVGSAFAH